MAVEEVADLVATDAKLKPLTKELAGAVRARGSHLMDLQGIGPAGAARILADVGDVGRFRDRNHFASWTGTAPLDASSGEQIRHRLSRAGNRRLNHVLHMAAIAQIRLGGEGQTYYLRKIAEAKTHKEARRCLKRRLSDMVYRQLVADPKPIADAAAVAAADDADAGPGGHSGASLTSSAADLHTPVIGSSDQPQPEPAPPKLPATPQALGSPAPAPARRSRQDGAPRWTNDLDGDKHRRTLRAAENEPLTNRGEPVRREPLPVADSADVGSTTCWCRRFWRR